MIKHFTLLPLLAATVGLTACQNTANETSQAQTLSPSNVVDNSAVRNGITANNVINDTTPNKSVIDNNSFMENTSVTATNSNVLPHTTGLTANDNVSTANTKTNTNRAIANTGMTDATLSTISAQIPSTATVQSSNYGSFTTSMPTTTMARSTATPAVRAQATRAPVAIVTNNVSDSSVSALNMARANPNLSIMVEAIEVSGMGTMLRFAGDDYTIFAPTNAAFESFFTTTGFTKSALFADKSLVRGLLGYHVIKGNKPLYTKDMTPGTYKAFNDRFLTVTPQKLIMDSRGRVAHILVPDIMTSNGAVHIIDNVLFPAEKARG